MGRIVAVVVVLLLGLGPLGQGMTGPGPGLDAAVPEAVPHLLDPFPESDARALLSNIGGRFTENQGQYGEGAGNYYCVGDPLSLAIGPGWVSYHYHEEGNDEGVMVRVDFEGANHVEPTGSRPLSYPTNFFIGNDPDQWVVGARSFEEVRFRDLYDGIDLVYRFETGMLKYDLLVEPFVDISQVRFRYSGHEGLLIDEGTGDLVIVTPLIDLFDKAPVSFHRGPLTDHEIVSRYLLLDGDTLAFEVTGYDRSLPLIIDPGLVFSTLIGGNSGELVNLKVDEKGDVYLAGLTASRTFPTTPGAVSRQYMGNEDGFVCKLKSDGSDLLFSTFVGASAIDAIWAIDLDAKKNIIVTGNTNSTDFPVTDGSFQTDPGGKFDAFVLKLNVDCTRIIWSTLLGGSNSEGGSDLGILSTGDIVISGKTTSSDFPMTDDSFDDSLDGTSDAFVTRFSPDGTQIIGSTYIGGSGNDSTGNESVGDDNLVIGPDDMVYLSIWTTSTDIPTSQDAAMPRFNGMSDMAVFKLNANLTNRIYATYLGGSDIDGSQAITVDGSSCVYLTGVTRSDDFPTTDGAWDQTITREGKNDGFLTKLSPDGSSLEFSTFFGGIDEDLGWDIELGDNGLIFFTVATRGNMLPTTEHSYDSFFRGCHDIYLGVLDGENQTLRYGTYLGGSDCEGLGAHLNVDGHLVTIAADSSSKDYPTTPGAFKRIHTGPNDIVVTRLDVVLSDPVLPGPPINLVATLDNLSVELVWDPPYSNGGFNLWVFRVYRGQSKDGMSLVDEVHPTQAFFNDTLPSPGQPYYYAITALSPAGESRYSNMVEVVLTTLPGPPGELLATPGCGTVQVNWSMPEYNGGSPILGYHVYRGTDVSDMEPITTVHDIMGYLDEGLVNGIRYFYKVSSFNALGNSTLSQLVSAMPKGPPLAPVGLEATIGDESITLRWDSPVSNGGSAIDGYRILRGYTKESLGPLTNVTWSEMIFVDYQVENGVLYYYAVRAFSDLGEGLLSTIINATPSGLPGIPNRFEVTARIGLVELSWEPPDENGGTPIEMYSVYKGFSEDSLVRYEETIGPVNSFVDTDLEYDKAVYYAVSAISGGGEGPKTETIEVWPFTLPDPPRDVSVEERKDVVIVSWHEPLRDGGAEVIDYVVYRGASIDTLEALMTLNASTLTFQDTKVVPGMVYYYAITALTSVGEGPTSEVVTAKPYTIPSAPTSLVYSIVGGDVELQWAPPTNTGGRPVLSYRVYRGTDPDSMEILTEVMVIASYTDRTAEPTLAHYYAISALNEAGEGPMSEPVSAGPALPLMLPGPVRNLRERVDGDTVTLMWEPPEYDGGSPVTGYVIFRGPSPENLKEIARMGDWVMYDDKGREAGKTYHYAVCAVNIVGEGEISDVIQVEVTEDGGILPWGTLFLWLIVSVVILGVVGGTAYASEPFKFSLALLTLPLFSRFKREQVMDNKNRYSIHGLIIDKPGIHYGEIMREFGLTNGVAAYHLRVLERENFIRSVSDGRLKRFYSTYTKVPKDLERKPEEIRIEILNLVRSSPGISQKGIITALGISRDSAGYFLREMVKEGTLKDSRMGKFTVYHLRR